ncbi:MAG: putative 2-aminoethylphosphonate ABC transporter permease subunit [Cellulosilyticaceae bacterium]
MEEKKIKKVKSSLKKWATTVTLEELIRGSAIYGIATFLMLCLILPLGTLFLKAFQASDGTFVGLQHFISYLSSPHQLRSITNTFFIATVSTCFSVTLAFAFAYVLSRKNVPWKHFFRYVGMLPLFAPTMLLGISLIYLFGNKGIFTAMGLGIPLYGPVGIIIAESIYCFPVATTILMVAFSAADNRLYEAAETMGTSPLRKMLTITLPSVKYGLISALFICFTYSFTDFGAPSVVGGNYNVLATDVYKQVIGQQNFNRGAVVGIILLFPAIVSFFVERVTSRKQSAAMSSRAIPYRIKKHPLSDRVATVFCSVIAVVLIGFFMVSLYASLIKLWPYNLSFTLEHYDFTKVASGDGLKAFKNSLCIAGLTAGVGTVITFMTAYFIEKTKGFERIRKLIYFLAITPLAVPGTVIGLSFILFFNTKVFHIPFTSYGVINPLSGIYGTLWILVLANTIHFFSVPFTTAMTALKRLDKEFETVSDAMGIPFYKTLRQVTLPMCMPALVEMAVYYFVNAMITVSAVVFLYAPTIKIAAVAIVNMQDAGDVAPAAAMSIIILIINLMVRLTYEGMNKWMQRRNQGGKR